MLGLLAVPFLPVRIPDSLHLFSSLLAPVLGNANGAQQIASGLGFISSGSWIREIEDTVSRSTPTVFETALAFLWLAGVLVMTVLAVRSHIRLRCLRRSALLLQNREVKQLYRQYLAELRIKRDIPIYSTVFLTSPVMAGCWKPGIYLPIRLVSDYEKEELRYMLLHELQHYRVDSWNQDQDLNSAMGGSVNWYFQALDQAAGISTVRDFVTAIGYGNETLTGDSPSFWLDSDLKISPVEQVEMLVKLENNGFPFAPEHMEAVRNSIQLDTSSHGTLYGKTGTGHVDGQKTEGWFVGYVARDGGNCYFAVHMTQEDATANADADSRVTADGSAAADIAGKILSELEIWK